LKTLPLLSILALLGNAAAATAADSSAPVKVTSCVVASSSVNMLLQPGISRTNGVTVTFLNSSSKTATAVTISGTYHGKSVTDTVKGKVGPGESAQITRAYTPVVYQGPDASCHVVHVDFADGTSWSAPAAMK